MAEAEIVDAGRDDPGTGSAGAATATPSAAPTATLPVVVNAPTSPILAPTGVGERRHNRRREAAARSVSQEEAPS